MSLTGERGRATAATSPQVLPLVAHPKGSPAGVWGQSFLEDRRFVSSQMSSQSQFIAWPHKCVCWQKGRIRGGEVTCVREQGGAGLDLHQDLSWLNVTTEQECKSVLRHWSHSN